MEFIILGISSRQNRTSININLVLAGHDIAVSHNHISTSHIFQYLELHLQDGAHNKEKRQDIKFIFYFRIIMAFVDKLTLLPNIFKINEITSLLKLENGFAFGPNLQNMVRMKNSIMGV